MNLTKAIEITDAKIQFVSLVDKAANKTQLLITKSEDGKANITSYGRILKADADTHYITGVVYAPMTEDAHGNYMTEAEIQKASNWFMKQGGKIDLQHAFEPVSSVAVVENYVAPCDMVVGDEPIAKGTWIMTVEVENPDIWDAVQKGEITGFSMGGVGKYSEEDVSLEDINKADEGTEKKGLFKKLASLFGLDVVEKGAMKDAFEATMQRNGFWDALNTLEDVLRPYNPYMGMSTFETDEATVREALSEFSEIITALLTDPNQSIAKALMDDQPAKNQKEEIELTKQELETTIDERLEKALAPIKKALEGEAEPAEATPPAAEPPAASGEGDNITKEDIAAVMDERIAKALEPFEALLKSRGVPNNLNDEKPVDKAEGHYLAGIL